MPSISLTSTPRYSDMARLNSSCFCPALGLFSLGICTTVMDSGQPVLSAAAPEGEAAAGRAPAVSAAGVVWAAALHPARIAESASVETAARQRFDFMFFPP